MTVAMERVQMALLEAGYTNFELVAEPDMPGGFCVEWIGEPAPIDVWIRALDLVGMPRRCTPCMRLTRPDGPFPQDPRPQLSDDCERTGRCA